MKISYAGYRFPPEVIHQAIWIYLRFTLSFRDVEDLLAERGIKPRWLPTHAMTRSNHSIGWAISGKPFAPVSHN
jgi:hypothetical protein